MASVCRALRNQTRPTGRKGKKLQFGFCYVTWATGVRGGVEWGYGVALSFPWIRSGSGWSQHCLCNWLGLLKQSEGYSLIISSNVLLTLFMLEVLSWCSLSLSTLLCKVRTWTRIIASQWRCWHLEVGVGYSLREMLSRMSSKSGLGH